MTRKAYVISNVIAELREREQRYRAFQTIQIAGDVVAQDIRAALAVIELLQATLTYTPPPGPPAPPPSHESERVAPCGHRLHWIDNQRAVCVGEPCLTPAWHFVIDASLVPARRLRSDSSPATLVFANKLRTLIAELGL